MDPMENPEEELRGFLAQLTGEQPRGTVIVAEANFDLLVQKIETLTEAVEKIETRFERRDEAQQKELAVRDARLRAVELELAVMKTKVLWIVTAASIVVSAIVSIAASLAVVYLGK